MLEYYGMLILEIFIFIEEISFSWIILLKGNLNYKKMLSKNLSKKQHIDFTNNLLNRLINISIN